MILYDINPTYTRMTPEKGRPPDLPEAVEGKEEVF